MQSGNATELDRQGRQTGDAGEAEGGGVDAAPAATVRSGPGRPAARLSARQRAGNESLGLVGNVTRPHAKLQSAT